MTKKLTTKEFIDKAKIIHKNRYDYSLTKYINTHIRVIITCTKHGEFTQTPHHHLITGGCPKCSKTYRYNTIDFIKKAREIHNNYYNYSKSIYINSKTKIIIICPLHGEFSQIPYHHLKGTKCKKCAYEKNKINSRYTTEEWIKKAKKIHNEKYSYKDSHYIDATTPIKIKCMIHGLFYQKPYIHLQSCGCNKCKYLIHGKKLAYTTKEFIKKATKKHKTQFDYSLVNYTNNRNRIDIICKKHDNIFNQIPKIHLKNNNEGCKVCKSCPECGIWRTMGKLCSYCKDPKDNKLYQKTKEYTIVKYLRDNLEEDFIHDKGIGSANCTDKRYRPDIRFDCINYQLIIEVDEYKHRGSAYSCDQKRMIEILAELGQPCIFLRYNPDNKNSDIEVLLQKVIEYLNIEIEYDHLPWNDYGLYVEYLFY